MVFDKNLFQCEILCCLMAKNMGPLFLQRIHYKKTVTARSLWLEWHVQGDGCAEGRLHNPHIWELWAGYHLGMGHTFEACESFVS